MRPVNGTMVDACASWGLTVLLSMGSWNDKRKCLPWRRYQRFDSMSCLPRSLSLALGKAARTVTKRSHKPSSSVIACDMSSAVGMCCTSHTTPTLSTSSITLPVSVSATIMRW